MKIGGINYCSCTGSILDYTIPEPDWKMQGDACTQMITCKWARLPTTSCNFTPRDLETVIKKIHDLRAQNAILNLPVIYGQFWRAARRKSGFCTVILLVSHAL